MADPDDCLGAEYGIYPAPNFVANLLSANLSESLSRRHLLTVCDTTFFHNLPLILGAIEQIGAHDLEDRDLFIQLLDALRIRVNHCRAIKLRFLLLSQTAAFRKSWTVERVHRRDCYILARQEHIEALEENLEESGDAIIRDTADIGVCSVSSVSSNGKGSTHKNTSQGLMVAKELLSDRQKMFRFVVTKMFPKDGAKNRDEGIPLGDHRHRFTIYRNCFTEKQAIDFVVENLDDASRSDAIALCERLRQEGIILRAGRRRSKPFADGDHPYHALVAIGRSEKTHSTVVNQNGQQVGCFRNAGGVTPGEKIRRINLRIPVDVLDLQSVDFWGRDIFTQTVEKGKEIGVRACTHPLIVTSPVNASSYVDPAKMTIAAVENSSEMSTSSLDDSTYSSGNNSEGVVFVSAVVKHVFQSIARPAIVSLRYPQEGALLSDPDMYQDIKPDVLVKTGDNLFQDQSAELMFRVFNYLWKFEAQDVFPDEAGVPYAHDYTVIPTSEDAGFMEAMTGLTSLKDYDWTKWATSVGKSEECINQMCRTAAGSYVAAYVLGVRDRHWDNILIKDDRTLLHIDFGFMLGSVPPIDGPRFSISPAMQAAFEEVGCWSRFQETAVKAFKVLRDHSGQVVRAAVLLFRNSGFEDVQIREFMRGPFSLNTHSTEEAALLSIEKQLSSSSSDWKTKLKSFSHTKVDPVFYGLLEKGFPPAVLAMKIVDAKEHKSSRLVAEDNHESVSAEQSLDLYKETGGR